MVVLISTLITFVLIGIGSYGLYKAVKCVSDFVPDLSNGADLNEKEKSVVKRVYKFSELAIPTLFSSFSAICAMLVSEVILGVFIKPENQTWSYILQFAIAYSVLSLVGFVVFWIGSFCASHSRKWKTILAKASTISDKEVSEELTVADEKELSLAQNGLFAYSIGKLTGSSALSMVGGFAMIPGLSHSFSVTKAQAEAIGALYQMPFRERKWIRKLILLFPIICIIILTIVAVR